jgi:hypothetical protein
MDGGLAIGSFLEKNSWSAVKIITGETLKRMV